MLPGATLEELLRSRLTDHMLVTRTPAGRWQCSVKNSNGSYCCATAADPIEAIRLALIRRH